MRNHLNRNNPFAGSARRTRDQASEGHNAPDPWSTPVEGNKRYQEYPIRGPRNQATNVVQAIDAPRQQPLHGDQTPPYYDAEDQGGYPEESYDELYDDENPKN